MTIASESHYRPGSDRICNLRTSTLDLGEDLPQLERDWLVGQLRARRGIRDVEYPGSGRRRLIVEHDADELSGSALLDLLDLFELHARPVPG
jgi:hypothetical protein